MISFNRDPLWCETLNKRMDTKTLETFPFLSGLRYQDTDYVGIIQNSDEKVISIYDLSAIKLDNDKKLFLEYGEQWWFESSRIIPINIFMHSSMIYFRYCIKTFPIKDSEVLFGPQTSLNNLIKKRIKKRKITLVQKTN